MKVAALRRYPVKSMLGEDVASLAVDERGADGDRRLALLDVETGRVATAKHPRRWRRLLSYAARRGPDGVTITLPDGRQVTADDPGIDELLSDLLGRKVHLAGERPAGAEVERPAPEDVLEHGVDAEVDYQLLEISQGAPGATFVDYAPLHLVTTGTVDAIGVETLRYRPNLVVSTPPDFAAYAETDWVGREIRIGEVRARGILPTPRCSVPTLEHGELGRAPQALRAPIAQNKVDVPGFGVLPCVGVYLEVLEPGTVRTGDPVRVS
ncbi:MOSC domain-containing protein [Pseudonocardia hispaniensis]|uniref:MOSC domain-containing protein n=1 Tax=Pseudonocardia hispaniensis TaxID=904933 RepID=A0ABW1J2I8_9PSEU